MTTATSEADLDTSAVLLLKEAGIKSVFNGFSFLNVIDIYKIMI